MIEFLLRTGKLKRNEENSLKNDEGDFYSEKDLIDEFKTFLKIDTIVIFLSFDQDKNQFYNRKERNISHHFSYFHFYLSERLDETHLYQANVISIRSKNIVEDQICLVTTD